MKPIDLGGFETKFTSNDDPWSTFTDKDEAVKRTAILHAMGPGPWGRVLELAAGNGSNSAAIAPRACRLDATEATTAGTALVARAIRARGRRARAIKLVLPARMPRVHYDIVLVAELLYYLSPREMRETARQVADVLRPGGTLVVAHHRIDFSDFVQHAHGLQRRFVELVQPCADLRMIRRTSHWQVEAARIG